MSALKQAAVESMLEDKTTEDLETIAIEATKKIPETERGSLIKRVSALGPPDKPTRNWLWLIVILSFAIVLIGTFITLALAVFKSKDTTTATMLANPELVLSMFTSVVGFFAGLFVQTPVQKT